MKFEYVLQIYWSKGILINAQLQPFNTKLSALFLSSKGFSWSTKLALISRFELYWVKRQPHQPLDVLDRYLPLTLNIMFSQLTSVNATVTELTRYNLLRLYLIKTTRGRSHALGKPSRGQRTWSNAWTAYNNNSETRAFINAYQKLKKKTVREERIDYRLIKKKSSLVQKKEAVAVEKIRVNMWF